MFILNCVQQTVINYCLNKRLCVGLTKHFIERYTFSISSPLFYCDVTGLSNKI